jgi:hypothetical protein
MANGSQEALPLEVLTTDLRAFSLCCDTNAKLNGRGGESIFLTPYSHFVSPPT